METAIIAHPPAAYMGGKRNLAARLCALIDVTPHTSYIEPFVGMGGVFLRRSRRPRVEIINDLSGDVANLFRVIRRHYEPFVDELRWMIASRAEFHRLKAVDPRSMTDIERAVRFLYLQRLTFGGKVVSRHFGVDKTTASRFNPGKLRSELRMLSRRLAPVRIEQLPYGECISRYDRAGALFYLDPPYDETTGYGVPFGRPDYVAMANQLATIAGDFIMSINDTPFIRETFAAFDIQEAPTTWTMSAKSVGAGQKVTELIIRNRR
ncbi:DNA adenine methylase [Sphingomonas aquatilis]|uniref:DNA adenine methylase n=1 Tax=Sphingomonas aquatilis TaxID=93063 RepID=UPI0023F907FE|nr:DNA adenine methylase [Sphingomonas aquatilis]MCI4653139.1 DNA adenine methylase [Sphingomonas aquatilis]